MNKIASILLLLCLLASGAYAQQDSGLAVIDTKPIATGDEGQGDDYFFDGNYKAALEEYLLVLERDPDNIKVNFNTGLCYLNSDYDKIKALPFFERVIYLDEEAAAVYYLMGRVYHFDHQFDRAIDMYNRFKQYYTLGEEFTQEDADIQIEYCENAYELMKFPVGCTFENLGPSINSEYPDYFPFVTLDERFVVFNSKRDDGSVKLKDGTFASNIYISEVVDGEFTGAKRLESELNDNAESETIIGMSGMGEKMLFMKGIQGLSGDIYEGDFDNASVTNVHKLSDRINSRSLEIAACISSDGNTMYFVSDRAGGYGGTDIWIAKRLPTGAWGVPLNLGPEINTERDEDFPNLSPDGDVLYFSSKGHFSMGGFDIFKAKLNPETGKFENPRNLGYPVNSVDDDMNYRVSKSGRYGYITALREDGYGDYDVYRLTINEVESEYSVLKGHISSDDKGRDVENTTITVTSLDDGNLYGYYTPNPSTMRYIIILPPGEFEVLVEADGMDPIAFEVKILGKSSFQPELDRDLVLSPSGS